MTQPSIEELQEKIRHYEHIFGVSDHDPAIKGYKVLVSILRQQNDFLDTFKISSFIGAEEKSDATKYKNAKELWENLPKMIENVNALRASLKIEGEDNKTYERPISAKDIANGHI
jgi:hypothetical protein